MTKNLLRFDTFYKFDNTDTGKQTELLPEGYSAEGFPRAVQYTYDTDYFWDI